MKWVQKNSGPSLMWQEWRRTELRTSGIFLSIWGMEKWRNRIKLPSISYNISRIHLRFLQELSLCKVTIQHLSNFCIDKHEVLTCCTEQHAVNPRPSFKSHGGDRRKSQRKNIKGRTGKIWGGRRKKASWPNMKKSRTEAPLCFENYLKPTSLAKD